jgi:hypothetical protein
MSALRRSLALSALVVAAVGASAQAAEPKLPRDGWVSWDVPAIDDAPAWCCFDWKARDSAPPSCKLDGHDSSYGTRHDEKTDSVTIYARTTAGKIDRLRVFSATCPVEARTPIDEQAVTPDESARWLIAQVDAAGSDAGERRRLADDALAALSMHRGDLARDGLIRVGNSDPLGDLRSKAWFWLAMTGAVNAESAISTAVRKDPDDHVREEAVFALSRLPDDRGTRALIAVAEDQSLSRAQRKRAVFWLSQSESSAALAYLDRILAATPATRK